MPAKTVELAVLDTSVYIENFRTGRFTQRITESPFLFRGISVVIHELLRGARRPTEQEFALDLAANLRLYTPTERIWLDSVEVVAGPRPWDDLAQHTEVPWTGGAGECRARTATAHGLILRCIWATSLRVYIHASSL